MSKWDYYKVRKGTPLTRSTKTPGAVRGLVHGTKGVKAQAEFFKVDKKSFKAKKRRSLPDRLLAFVAKSLVAAVAVSALVAVVAVLVAAVADGVSAGLADVAEAVSAASSYLVIGGSVAAVLAVGYVALRVMRAAARAQARASERAEAHAEAAAAASLRVHQTSSPQARIAQPAWPHQAAQAAQAAQATAIPADWYPDPSDTAQLRYWNGAEWTAGVRPRPDRAAAAAGWYPADSDATRLRYWDGAAWTEHFSPRTGGAPAARPATAPPATGPAPAGDGCRITMSSVEWQNHVRAWMAAGAVHEALWQRLSNARISDADEVTLEAQRRMEQLSAEQGAQRARQMLEANPRLRDELAPSDFLAQLLNNVASLDPGARLRLGRDHNTRPSGSEAR